MTDDKVVAHRGDWEDLGHSVKVQRLRNAAGALLALNWEHFAPDGTRHEDFVATTGYMGDGWTVVSESPLTLSPSLLCLRCRRHGFIRDGGWVEVG